MADTIGIDAAKKLEDIFLEYRKYLNNMSSRTNNIDNDSSKTEHNGKRKYVDMTQAKYCGTQERIYNTHHMP